MRILYLTPDLPEPPDQGGKLRNRALISAAAAHHQVDVLAFTTPNTLSVDGTPDPKSQEWEPPAGSPLAACRRVVTVPAPGPRHPLRRAWDLWFDQVPDLAHRLESPTYHEVIWDLLEQERYEVVQIEGLEMMPYLGAIRGAAPRAAVIYDAHNAEMTLQRTMWQAELRRPARWHGAMYSFTQWSKLGTYERVMMNSTDMVLAVSPEDAGRLKGRHVTPELVPNGIDTTATSFQAPPPDPVGPPSLFFVGPLAYRPNADAVHWLARGILPAVRARRPEVRLRLVGRGSERITGAGIDALGYVTDASAELARAAVLVVPMRMGGGVRFKVLEAMAAGVPVVSTPMGLAGIAVEPGVHALVATTTSEFAHAISQVLDDPALATRLTAAARRLVETRYDWRQITPGYLRLLSAARHQVRSGR